jgi:hypothetical protein
MPNGKKKAERKPKKAKPHEANNLLTLHSTIILSIFLYSLIFYLAMSNRRNIG